MEGPTQERWRELAAQAVMEQDPATFAKLVHELNDILEAKQDAINKLRNEQRPPTQLNPHIPLEAYAPKKAPGTSPLRE